MQSVDGRQGLLVSQSMVVGVHGLSINFAGSVGVAEAVTTEHVEKRLGVVGRGSAVVVRLDGTQGSAQASRPSGRKSGPYKRLIGSGRVKYSTANAGSESDRLRWKLQTVLAAVQTLGVGSILWSLRFRRACFRCA